MKRWVLLIGLTSAFSLEFIQGQLMSADEDWQKIRATQPEGVRVDLILPKTHFAQGERIEATLHFTNTSPNFYRVSFGVGEPGAIFHAYDVEGHAAIDPQKWLFDWLTQIIIGPSLSSPMNDYTLHLTVNKDICFAQPGAYTLYSVTSLHSKWATQNGLEVVSQKVTLVIDPLTPEKEQSIILEARKKIAQGGKAAEEGIKDLGYLRTAAAYNELIPLLSQDSLMWLLNPAFLQSPHPADQARAILNAVKQRKVIVCREATMLYAQLRTSNLIFGVSRQKLSQAEADKIQAELNTSFEAARKEILVAQMEQ